MTAMNTGIAAGMTNHLPLERLMVFTGNANPRLAQEVAKHLNLSLGRAIVGKFSDGEVMVELLENVRGKDVFVMTSNVDALFARHGFDESQIFRIDHYLGKETVQNILVFRFGNSIFEPIWNRNYIDHVQITVAEKLGVELRGGYYDSAGAMRDILAGMIHAAIMETTGDISVIAGPEPVDSSSGDSSVSSPTTSKLAPGVCAARYMRG